ncbi:MAG: transketolase, partial [Vallitaleaceae bacterium]|nr:transketolase [Vallitaleaceae bacterium]
MSADQKTINAIRILSAEAIQKANSGHPGLPMGGAPMAYTLWAKQMKHNPKNPNWFDRDRFVLSAGHGSMLLYSLLHLFEYGLPMEDLKEFRQLNSKTPGHPEFGHTVGIETTTGPLGQGMANAVGMAMAESYMSEKFNKADAKIIDHYTYALVGDGCLQEGITSEAASLAGTLGLSKLVVFYDSNHITIEGSTDISFRENVKMRFEAYNWEVIVVADGNDVVAIEAAIVKAKSSSKPTLIKVETIIGYGCEAKQGTHDIHGAPLGKDHLAETKAFLNWDSEPFEVPSEVTDHMKTVVAELGAKEDDWNALYADYKTKYPAEAKELMSWLENDYVDGLLDLEGYFDHSGDKATRVSSFEVLQKLSKAVPNIIGGAADLAPSTKSNMVDRGDFSPEDHSGSNLHFGVREHAMAAIINGLTLHGGLKAYCAGFFVFSDYMKPSMRLAALMGIPTIYIMTHDSIGVGEDGPTHQPIEHLLMLRSIPNFNVIRPCDYNETAAAWYVALSSPATPTALILSRQNLKQYDTTGLDLLKGAYI